MVCCLVGESTGQSEPASAFGDDDSCGTVRSSDEQVAFPVSGTVEWRSGGDRSVLAERLAVNTGADAAASPFRRSGSEQ